MLEAKIKSKKGTCEVTQRLITAGNSPPTRAGRVKGKIGPAVTDPRAAGAGMFTTNWQEAGSQHPGWPCQCPAVATAKGARDTSSAQPRFLEPLLQQRHPSLWHPTSGCITAQIETQPHRQPLLLKGMDWEKKQLEWGHRGRSWWSWRRWGLNSVSASRSSNPSTPSEDSDPALPEDPVITSSAAVALKDTADHPQDWPRAPLFTSRPIAKHPSKPKGWGTKFDPWGGVLCSKRSVTFLTYADIILGNICGNGY